MRLDIAKGSAAAHLLGISHGDISLTFTHDYDRADGNNNNRRIDEIGVQIRGCVVYNQRLQGLGQCRYNASKNNKRRAVTHFSLGYEFAKPHEKHCAGSDNEHNRNQSHGCQIAKNTRLGLVQ